MKRSKLKRWTSKGSLSGLFQIDRTAFFSCLITAGLSVGIPYFVAWGGKIILDALNAQNWPRAYQLVLAVTLVVAVLGLIKAGGQAHFSYLKWTMLRKMKALMAQKGLQIELATLEQETPKQLLATLDQYDNTGAMGPLPFLTSLYDCLSSSLSSLIAIGLTLSFYFKPAVTGLPVWIENAMIPILIIGYAFLSIKLAVWVQGHLNLEALIPEVGRRNAIASYYMENLFEPEQAKAARLGAYELYRENLMDAAENPILLQLMKRLDHANLKVSLLTELAKSLLSIVIYVLIALKTWAGVITIGEALLYSTTFFLLSQALGGVFSELPMLLNQKDYFQRFQAFMQLPESTRQVTSTQTLGCQSVDFSYPGADHQTLSAVTLEIASGQKVALVGENGSGKTTLVKLLTGLYQPTGGHVEAPSSLSAVFQDFELLNGKLKDLLLAGQPETPQRIKRLTALLEQFGLTQRIAQLPHGLETEMGLQLYPDSGIEWSGGERQKLAMIRALLEPHAFLIMDEPTAALDPVAEAEIYQMLGQVTEDRGVLLISHRLSSCIFCDHIYVLKSGQVVEQGTHQALLKQGGYYKTLWDAQASLYQSV